MSDIIRFEIFLKEDLSADQKIQIVEIHKQAYPEYREKIDEITLWRLGEEFPVLLTNDKIIAVASVKKHRIIWFGIQNEFRGKLLSIDLLSYIHSCYNRIWISIGLEYIHVMRIVLKAGFSPIKDTDLLYNCLMISGKNKEKFCVSCLSKDLEMVSRDTLMISRLPGEESVMGHGNSYLQVCFESSRN